jgi:hypothetical protein
MEESTMEKSLSGISRKGISFLLDSAGGQVVTVDEMFANNNLALHYTNFTSVCMAELFDIVNEFITTQSKCQTRGRNDSVRSRVRRGPRVVSLSAFRKELSNDMLETTSVHVFNYDPFVVQEANAKMVEEEEDDNDHPAAGAQHQEQRVRKWQKKNMGATIHLGTEIHVTTEKTSLQTL